MDINTSFNQAFNHNISEKLSDKAEELKQDRIQFAKNRKKLDETFAGILKREEALQKQDTFKKLSIQAMGAKKAN